MKKLSLAYICSALFLGGASLSRADQVIMKNGDRITGEIQQIWDNEVIIEPEYDDDVKVSIGLDLVDYIESEREFEVTLADGREVVATLVGRAETGEQIVEIDGQAMTVALSQIIELDEIDDYFDWESHVDINAAINKGNTDSVNTKFYADTNLKIGDHRQIASLTLNREEQDGLTTKEQDILRYNYNWLFSDPWFLGASFSAERDPIRNLDHRYILGVTSGRDIWNTPRLFLNFQIGLGYLTEEDTLGERDDSSVAIWALRYRQELIGDLEIYHDDSITYYFTGRTNTVIKTATGVRYEITDLLYLNLSVDYDYEKDPSAGAENDDLSVVFGLGVEF
jgi:putative salt-induced outer membrane protein YdiY